MSADADTAAGAIGALPARSPPRKSFKRWSYWGLSSLFKVRAWWARARGAARLAALRHLAQAGKKGLGSFAAGHASRMPGQDARAPAGASCAPPGAQPRLAHGRRLRPGLPPRSDSRASLAPRPPRAQAKEKELGSEPWFDPEGGTAAKVGLRMSPTLRRAPQPHQPQTDLLLTVHQPLAATCSAGAVPGRIAARAARPGRRPCQGITAHLAPRLAAPAAPAQRQWLEARSSLSCGRAVRLPGRLFEGFYIVVSGGRRAWSPAQPLLSWDHGAVAVVLRQVFSNR